MWRLVFEDWIMFRSAIQKREWASRLSTPEGSEGHQPAHFTEVELGINCRISAVLSISQNPAVLLQVSSLACPPPDVEGLKRDTSPIRYSGSGHEDSPKLGRDPTSFRSGGVYSGWRVGMILVVGRNPQVIVK